MLLDNYLAWPMTLPETTREQLAELRESFSNSSSSSIPTCCGAAREDVAEEEFPYLGRISFPAQEEQRCSPGSSSKMMKLSEKLMMEDTSVGTSSTLEESIVSGPDQSYTSSTAGSVVVRRLGRMEVPKFKSSRKRRPRRRVCLLENCHCPYHELAGPIDVDSICEELSRSTHGHGNSELTSFQYEHEESISRRDDSESSSGNQPETVNLTIAACCMHKNRGTRGDHEVPDSRSNSSSDRKKEEDFDLSIFLEETAELVLDEDDMSRGLVGYQEGCEPEVIAKFSDSDVQRWELEDLEEQQNDNTLDLLYAADSNSQHSKESHKGESPGTTHSRGSSSKHSRTTVQSRQSRSQAYLSTIPASAAEV